MRELVLFVITILVWFWPSGLLAQDAIKGWLTSEIAVSKFGILHHVGTLEEMEELGVKWMRRQMYWDWGTWGKGHDFNPKDYQGLRIDEWVEKGFKLYALLSNHNSVPKADEREKFAKFAYDFAKYYAGKIDYIELMNEPPVWNWNAEQLQAFTEAMVLAARRIKEANPKGKVILEIRQLPEPHFSTIAPYLDYAAYHPYRWVPEKHASYKNPFVLDSGDGGPYDRSYEEWYMQLVSRHRQANSAIQFMNTEIGFRDNSLNRDENTLPPYSPKNPKDKWGGSEIDTAKFLLRNAFIEMALPVPPLTITWFYDKSTPELVDGQALIVYTGQKRKAYEVYKNLTALVDDSWKAVPQGGITVSLTSSLDSSKLVYRAFLVERSDGKRDYYIAYWDGFWQPWEDLPVTKREVAIEGIKIGAGGKVELFDLWEGSRQVGIPYEIVAGKLRIKDVKYSDYPYLLKISTPLP